MFFSLKKLFYVLVNIIKNIGSENLVDLNIINGNIFFENNLIELGLSISNGKIVAISKDNSLPKAEKTIDAKNKIILPGGIDVHTHILDLIYSYRDDFIRQSLPYFAGSNQIGATWAASCSSGGKTSADETGNR